MERYVYQPLDLTEESFRLIRLVKGTGLPIRCELFHALLQDLDSFVEYEALSYTWGGTTKTQAVEMDVGTILPVTQNLLEALQHLRFPHEDRILWIDAISIDQDNIKERGHQVRRMRAIYEGAVRVNVWLGRPTPYTDLVLRNMQKFEKEARSYPCNDWQPSDERWHDIWCRSWFDRVWIIQEVAHARTATIICGHLKVSSRIFVMMPLVLNIELVPLCQAILDVMPGPFRRYSWWSKTRNLRTLLSKFSHSQASDERDKIFALLGLSSDANNSVVLYANYSIPTVMVLHNLISFLVS
ncbi:HET-domain-containing protein, partial [Plenodomus tracheiphilus IPT5]